jgi:hypothetical protein
MEKLAQLHEWMFYEVMWRSQYQGRRLPLPWRVQQYFRVWSDSFERGLFSTKEAAFVSNAHYRYWNMVGVKDHQQESLVGQAGESAAPIPLRVKVKGGLRALEAIDLRSQRIRWLFANPS